MCSSVILTSTLNGFFGKRYYSFYGSFLATLTHLLLTAKVKGEVLSDFGSILKHFESTQKGSFQIFYNKRAFNYSFMIIDSKKAESNQIRHTFRPKYLLSCFVYFFCIFCHILNLSFESLS